MARRGRPKHPDILTPREWDVLALLREGCTNDEIASRLGISVSTARYHVSEILGKLAVTSREEAARWQPDAASTPGRRFALAAPLAFVRRLGGLGAGARLAAGGVLAVAAVGVGLLAWGVMRSRGSARSDGGAPGPARVARSAIACTTPQPTPAARPVEAGTAPIFWRFGLTDKESRDGFLTSGQYCGHDLKIIFRVTNQPDCVSGQPGPDLQAGNVATGEHVTAHLTCITENGTDLPGAVLCQRLHGAERRRVAAPGALRAGLSTQTVRIGGADVPHLAGGPAPPCAPPQQQPGGGTPAVVVLVERATGNCHVIPTADRLMQAKWVQDGKTFVAYDIDTKNSASTTLTEPHCRRST